MSNLPERDEPTTLVQASFETATRHEPEKRDFAAVVWGVASFVGNHVLLPALLGLRAPVARETLRSLDDRSLARLGLDRRDLETA